MLAGPKQKALSMMTFFFLLVLLPECMWWRRLSAQFVRSSLDFFNRKQGVRNVLDVTPCFGIQHYKYWIYDMNGSFCMFVACTLDVERFGGPVAQRRAFEKLFSMVRMSTSCSRAVVKHSFLDACLFLFSRGFDCQCLSRLKGCSFAVDMQVVCKFVCCPFWGILT